jgi:hypothetical protein
VLSRSRLRRGFRTPATLLFGKKHIKTRGTENNKNEDRTGLFIPHHQQKNTVHAEPVEA